MTMTSDDDGVALPRKYDIFGVDVSATTYDGALEAVLAANKAGRPTCMTHLAVHGLIEATKIPDFSAIINDFDIVAPDGQPVRHALNLLHHTALPENCRGPQFINPVCQAAANEGIGVYFYGSTTVVVEALQDKLSDRFEGLRIVGAEPSLFRPLTEEEKDALVCRINDSGAGIVFFGLGYPLQERFAHALKDRINAVIICNGAAFEMHAGFKKMAPRWMQRYSIEWVYRMMQEPRRLFGRYLLTNSNFLLKLFLHYTGLKKTRR